MAFSKAKLYTESEQLTSYYCKAFSHPARLRIISQLYHFGPTTVEELMRTHPLSDPTFSEHLKMLRVLGMVSFQERFPHIIYSLEEENLSRAEKYFNLFFDLSK